MANQKCIVYSMVNKPRLFSKRAVEREVMRLMSKRKNKTFTSWQFTNAGKLIVYQNNYRRAK